MSLWSTLAVADADRLPRLLARLRWSDLGLALAAHLPARGWANLRPYYSDVCEVGLFFLPRGESIPLHDHPAMHVYMRVLLGTLHVTSFTLADPTAPARPVAPALARRTADTDLDPSSPVWLVEPHRDNLHALTARADVAFLDVLRPPYVAGRVCTYYDATPTHDDLWQLAPRA